MRPDFHGHAARAGGIPVRAEIFREGNRGWLREGVRIEGLYPLALSRSDFK